VKRSDHFKLTSAFNLLFSAFVNSEISGELSSKLAQAPIWRLGKSKLFNLDFNFRAIKQ